MKLNQKNGCLYVCSILSITFSWLQGAEKRSVTIESPELPKAVVKSMQVEPSQIQELKMRLAFLQDRIENLEQLMDDYAKKILDNDAYEGVETARQKLTLFLKDNAIALISLACTLTGLYMTYYYSRESLKLNRASFLLDKGAVAFEHLWMVTKNRCSEYLAIIKKAAVQFAA